MLRLSVLFLLALFPPLLLAAPESAQPPNIILILSDDVGAETIGAYGGESYQTPNIDRLATDGMRFEYGHAQPLCTPSRVKIMTGKHNFRNYRHFSHLDPAEKTFAHLLKAAGYDTTVAGKWQLFNQRFSDVEGALPADAGFDEYLLWQLKNEQRGSRYWGPALNHNGRFIRHDKASFGPDIINDYVLNYIEQHRERPFLIYYPMVLAHDPWVTTPDMQDESASDQMKFAAMMAYMDKMVGNVRRKVEATGMADRTLIFFIGDNGTGRDIVSRFHGRDVQGAKGLTINAGTRVPFIAWGPPDLIKAGGISGSLVNLNDMLPTLAGLAGVGLPEDNPGAGITLLPVLQGNAELDRDTIFIHYEPFWPTSVPARYALDRRWKLYQGGKFFDTEADPLETSALNIAELDEAGEAAKAYRALATRIENMPGELQSTHRWIPRQAYYLLAATLIVLILIIWVTARYLRRR